MRERGNLRVNVHGYQVSLGGFTFTMTGGKDGSTETIWETASGKQVKVMMAWLRVVAWRLESCVEDIFWNETVKICW